VWMKSLSPLPDNQIIQRAALVYASDYTILEPIYRKHGIPWSTPGLKAASLDHAMWFHRDANINDWVLYVQESPSAQGGRGLSFGKIYTREGMLIASVAQEGMVRVPQIG
jgi:acyl-CoA thioesterase II